MFCILTLENCCSQKISLIILLTTCENDICLITIKYCNLQSNNNINYTYICMYIPDMQTYINDNFNLHN